MEIPTYNYDTMQLIEHFGYVGEQHAVYTPDGHVLVLHRIARGKPSRASSKQTPGHPVIVQHGLMMNSEAWVTTPDGLAFVLADAGFDVWLGNARGNRYSCKHTRLSSRSAAFWNFCIDEHALQDFPAVLQHVLAHTGARQAAYIGFSQGTAQMFAALSSLPSLAQRLSQVIALAPAARCRGLTSGLLRTFVDCAPESLYLLFGDRAMLSSALFWRSWMPPSIFVRAIDMSTRYLFGWRSANISRDRKLVCYPHLYSYGSVKNVVHWFQIVIANRFQAFDDRYATRSTAGAGASYAGTLPPEYPLGQIRAPLALFYGGADALPDMDWLLAALRPTLCCVKCIPHYEHLDFVWADDAATLVYGDVVRLLREAATRQ